MIEPVSNSNLNEVLPLIRKYQEFYQVSEISDEKNLSFFSQFGSDSSLGCQFVIKQDNKAIGFATVYFTFSSTLTGKVAVLNDLFVLPDYRGKGLAKKLINHCHYYAIKNQAVRLQWLTASDNSQAQKVYDAMKVNKSEWIFYSYDGE